MLKEGDKAPNFKGIDQNNEPIELSNFSKKKLILYFYPKDDTPWCTKEASNLRDNSAKHTKFIAKYNLPFSLLADTEKEVIKSYNCWGLKKFMGREYEGILRKTFVIENNTIIKIFEKVKTTDHFNQIIEALN